jgi:hypothetical protein
VLEPREDMETWLKKKVSIAKLNSKGYSLEVLNSNPWGYTFMELCDNSILGLILENVSAELKENAGKCNQDLFLTSMITTEYPYEDFGFVNKDGDLESVSLIMEKINAVEDLKHNEPYAVYLGDDFKFLFLTFYYPEYWLVVRYNGSCEISKYNVECNIEDVLKMSYDNIRYVCGE